jgi:hypothetical protein
MNLITEGTKNCLFFFLYTLNTLYRGPYDSKSQVILFMAVVFLCRQTWKKTLKQCIILTITSVQHRTLNELATIHLIDIFFHKGVFYISERQLCVFTICQRIKFSTNSMTNSFAPERKIPLEFRKHMFLRICRLLHMIGLLAYRTTAEGKLMQCVNLIPRCSK